MTMEGLESYAVQRGWKMSGKTALCIWSGGYPVWITRAANGAASGWLRAEPWKEATKVLKPLKKELKGVCTLGAVNNGTLCVTSRSRGDDAIGQMEQGLNALTAALREAGCTPPGQCPICKQTGCDAAAVMGGGFVPVHEACLHNHAEDTAQKAEQNMLTGNYITGFIGALLGGLVGTLPSLLSILLLERIAVILYALIPLGAFYGYKLLKGKMNRFAMVSSLISGVLNIFSLNFLVFAVAMLQRYGALPMEYLFYTFFYDLGALLQSMIIDFVFLALGLFVCYGQISRTATTDVISARSAESTLTPLHEQTRI